MEQSKKTCLFTISSFTLFYEEHYVTAKRENQRKESSSSNLFPKKTHYQEKLDEAQLVSLQNQLESMIRMWDKKSCFSFPSLTPLSLSISSLLSPLSPSIFLVWCWAYAVEVGYIIISSSCGEGLERDERKEKRGEKKKQTKNKNHNHLQLKYSSSLLEPKYIQISVFS